MSFLCDNLAAFVVAGAVSLMAWLFGGTRGDLLIPVVPWVFALLVEVLLFFPQRHHGESTFEARTRHWRQLRRDPVLWLSVVLFVLLLVPFFNYGFCPNCCPGKVAQGFNPKPPVPVIPYCVNLREHLNIVNWFAIALPAMLVVRRSLVRRGRRLVIKLIVWNGFALALLGFVQSAMGAPGPLWDVVHNGSFWGLTTDFFSTFGYSNMGGDYFAVLFCLAAALWRDCRVRFVEDFKKKDISKSAPPRPRMFWKKNLYLIPTMLFFFAAISSYSRAAMILVTVAAVVCFVHTLICILAKMSRARRVVVTAWSVAIFVLAVTAAVSTMPKNIQKEIDKTGTTEVLDRVSGKSTSVSLAIDIWKDHKLFGCGGWGFRHLVVPKMVEKEMKVVVQEVGGMNVHNDCLQFLTEHGLVGFGLIVAIVVGLLWPICSGWRRLATTARFEKGHDRPPRPVQIFALPAAVLFILMALFITFVHSFGDCPLRSAATLSLFFVELAALSGFMPRLEK